MNLTTFHLDKWFETHQDTARYNLGASTGPKWTLDDLLELMTSDEKECLHQTPLTYCPGSGRESLRAEIASMYGANPDDIQIVTGASEALLSCFYLAAEPGANIVVTVPCFPPFLSLPESLGLETRHYVAGLHDESDLDVDRIKDLTDARTKLILINSPQNPTGATASEAAISELDEFAATNGIRLVVDEVYHPIYHGSTHRSAGEYSQATVLGDFSKAFSLPGLRIGWVLERDSKRREDLWNIRAQFTISSSTLGEILAEVATRHRDLIYDRARETSTRNLELLDDFLAQHEHSIEWTRPTGGMTMFPRLRTSESSRNYCEAAVARGVLLAPGDCFGFPAHFRIGFGVCAEGFAEALDILSEILR